MRNRRIKKILGAMLAAAIVCQTSASPGVLTVRAETADSVTADSSTADSSAADSAVDEQEQIRHGDMDENTGAEEDVDVNQGVDVEAAIGGTEEKAADAVQSLRQKPSTVIYRIWSILRTTDGPMPAGAIS